MYLINSRSATFILGQEVAEVQEWATGIWCRLLKGRPRLVKRDWFRLESMIREKAENGFRSIQYSPRIMVIWDDRKRNGWQFLTYLGFSEEESAHTMARWLSQKGFDGTVRRSKRLKTCSWEVKVRGLPWEWVETLIQKDLNTEERIKINQLGEMVLQG